MKTRGVCKLCGLPVKNPTDSSKDLFCCSGCKMVYAMLTESDLCKDQKDFKDTKLYKECVAAGIIPDASGKKPEPRIRSTQVTSAEITSAGSSPETSSTNPPGAGSDADTNTENLLAVNFQIQHMWCPACAWVLEKALSQSNGVEKAWCNFSSDRGSVTYNPVITSPEKIFGTIRKLGYEPYTIDGKSRKNTKEFIRLFVVFFLTMNVMMLSWAIYSGFFIELSPDFVQLLSWPVFLMASVVVFWGGHPIYSRAITSVKSGRPGMETLISTGSFATYFYSLFHIFKGSLHLYFDAASMLILLTLTGKLLERSAKNKIAEGFWGFFSLVPQKVRLCTDLYPEGRYVSIKQLSKGDIFMAEQGEILAADGFVIKGRATIDESSITGEAKPVNAALKDKVKSGTRIISGKVKVKAGKVGEASILGRMLLIMENSLSGKTVQTQRFETLLKFFVPGIIGLSVFTFLFWFLKDLSAYEAFNRGISVLVISCPCALGIAIPLALVAGVSAAGKKGILVRDFEAFERIDGLDTIVFDKTGTLTTGKLDVLGMDTAKNFSAQKAWPIVCAMEKGLNHYIAQTIRTYSVTHHIAPCELENIVHHPNGIRCRYQGKSYCLGSLAFVNNKSGSAPSFVSPPRQGAQIISSVFLSEDDKIVAAVHLGDAMKRGVKELVADLGAMGLSCFLISGDAEETSQKAGSFVQIPAQCIHGGLLPHEKADFITQLKQAGKKTAMVGDGANDSPAMAQSDIAIAVHSGLNPGDGVAAITLMQETPVQLIDFISLAKRVNRKVRQNLWFALSYNLISIPLAAGGFLNPIIAATAMLLSSLSVTFNTLLLIRRESKPDV